MPERHGHAHARAEGNDHTDDRNGRLALPTLPSSARSISMPTCSSSSSTPISASTVSDTPRVSVRCTRPSAEGPMTTPARISPSTAGIRRRSASSATQFGRGDDDQQVEQEASEVESRLWRGWRSRCAGRSASAMVAGPAAAADGADGVGALSRGAGPRALSQRRWLRPASAHGHRAAIHPRLRTVTIESAPGRRPDADHHHRRSGARSGRPGRNRASSARRSDARRWLARRRPAQPDRRRLPARRTVRGQYA